MKHSINLFQQDMIPEQPWFTLSRVLLVMVGLVLILGFWKVGLVLQTNTLADNAQTQRTVLAEQQQELTRLTERLRTQTPSADLQSEVNRLENEVATRQYLLAEFQRRGQIQQHDYAGLLTDLALLHRDGVWLTRIHQDRGRINLHGHAVSASVLPAWMQSFSESTVLSERRFNMVELKRDNRELLSFVLQGSTSGMPQVPAVANDESAAAAEGSQ